MYGYFGFIDENGKELPKLKILLYRNGQTDSYYLFTSQVAENGNYIKGKPILLVLEPELADENNPDFYLLPASLNGRMNTEFPYEQFK